MLSFSKVNLSGLRHLVIGSLLMSVVHGCSQLEPSKRGEGTHDGAVDQPLPQGNNPGGTALPAPQTSAPLKSNLDGTNYPEHFNDGSEIAALKDEPDYLNARWKLLDSAKQAVWIQAYIFKADYTGRQFAKKLLELKRRGIDVRVVIDEQVNIGVSSQALYADLYQKGLKIIGFNPLYRGMIFPLTTTGNIGTYLNQQNKRSHEKMFIVDPLDPVNKRAIIGGTNIADDYFSILPADTGGYWRDKDVILKGPIVDDIADNFNRSYAYHVSINSNLTSGAVLPPTLSTMIQSLLAKEPIPNPIAVARFAEHVSKPLNINWAPAKMRFLTQSMVTGHPGIYNEYLSLINAAKSEVIIANGYFIPNQEQIDAIKAAARRGVKVRILTNSEETTDFSQVARAGRLLYPSVIDDSSLPIEIYEWGIPGSKRFGLYHSKILCIDQLRCIVGSFNFDPRSRKLNNEVAVTFESQAAVAPVFEMFNRDVSPTTSVRFTLEMANQIANPPGLKDQGLNALIRTFLHIF